jgi:hypothetical protein
MSIFSRKVAAACIGILLINAIGVWGVIFLDRQKIQALEEKFNQSPVQEKSTSESKPETKTSNTELQKLQDTQESLSDRVEDLEESVDTLESKKTTSAATTTSTKTTSSGKKEYTIYLGEGTTSNRDWTTVQSTTITVDTNKYPGLTTVYFEAGLSIVGGEAYAQLIDSSSGAVVSPFAVMNNTQNPTWKSTQVNLNSGSDTYVVQIRSSSGELTTLSGARLRIIAD